MTSEWMKVMLDEIARKKAEAEQQRLEVERRGAELERRRAESEPPGAEPAAVAPPKLPAADRPA